VTQIIPQQLTFNEVIRLLNFDGYRRSGSQIIGPCPSCKAGVDRFWASPARDGGARLGCRRCGAKNHTAHLYQATRDALGLPSWRTASATPAKPDHRVNSLFVSDAYMRRSMILRACDLSLENEISFEDAWFEIHGFPLSSQEAETQINRATRVIECAEKYGEKHDHSAWLTQIWEIAEIRERLTIEELNHG
jgi:hypothetical protein